MRRVIVTAAVLVLLALTGCTSNEQTSSSDFRFVEVQPKGEVIDLADRQNAPAIKGKLLDGQAYDLSTLTGKIVVLNFWAEWCPPCRTESPELQEIYQEYEADGVQLVGVAVKTSDAKATAFVEDYGITYPNLYDPRSEVALQLRSYPASAMPSTLIIDAKGKVAAVYTGAVEKADLSKTLDTLLAEP